MKCYKTVLKIKGLIKNYGFFIISFIIFFYFLTLFIFCFCAYIKLMRNIKSIFSALKRNQSIQIRQESKTEIKKIQTKKNKRMKNQGKKDLKKKDKKIKDNTQQLTQNIAGHSTIRKNSANKKSFKTMSIKDKTIKEILEKKDFELNSLDYEEAIKLDKRTYCIYYISLIKNNHPFIFSFGCSDYNSGIIKMFLFFFSFSLDLTINAMFFNDDTMHKIYEDKGKFNFLYQIPQILYSTFISKLIDSIVRKLALSQDNFVDLKQEKENLDKKYIQIKRILKIKFIFFFFISFIVLVFFWYYIVCFCGIYVNTQIHLIKDSVFSLLTGLFSPFILCLIPGVFRIPALSVNKPTRGFLYRFSSLLENILC